MDIKLKEKYDYLFEPQEGKHKVPIEFLQKRQALDLDVKIHYSEKRLKQFYEKYNGNICVSYSGGIDSQVVLHLAKSLYPNIKTMNVQTGMELETKEYALKYSDYIYYPKQTAYSVWDKYGMPFPSKQQAYFLYQAKNTKSDYLRSRLMTGIMKDGSKTMFKIANKWQFLLNTDYKFSDRCCYVLKKEPFNRFYKEHKLAFVLGNTAEESMLRKKIYMQKGCINLENNQLWIVGFWTHQNILEYIKKYNVDYCKSAYGDIIKKNGKLKTTKANRTGCLNCLFGIHLEPQPNRLQRMQVTDPHMWKSLIIGKKIGKLLDMCDIPYKAEKTLKDFEK